MPELPEVETVRSGLAGHILGRTVAEVQVRRASTVRRQVGGTDAFVALTTGRRITAAVRRGKFLWLLLDDAPGAASDDDDAHQALLAHLGMSGQLLVRGRVDVPGDEHPHLRARLRLSRPEGPPGSHGRARPDGGLLLDFVDQRTFGYLWVCPLVPTSDGAPGGRGSARPVVPEPAAHIARDLLDPHLDRAGLVGALRRRRTGIKRALLDQTLVSGIGNIYADEALWRAGVHAATATDALTDGQAHAILDSAERVMRDALEAGGTSFDSLYVNVNGASGYFDRSLAVYGREGLSCPRCGTDVVREPFAGRSSFRCPRCQPVPRPARRATPRTRIP